MPLQFLNPFHSKIEDGISLITAVKNRTENLKKVLPSWLQQPEIDEIILVDWDSEESLTPLIQSFDDSRIYLFEVKNQPSWNLTAAFNLAAQLATRSQLIKVDADIILYPSFFEHHKLQAGMFYRGDHTQARNQNEIHLNGFVFLWRDDFFRINGYNEFIDSYGWDDSDLYERLQSQKLSFLPINNNFLYHLPHQNRNTYQPHSILVSDEALSEYKIHRNQLLTEKYPWKTQSQGAVFSVAQVQKNKGLVRMKQAAAKFSEQDMQAASQKALLNLLSDQLPSLSLQGSEVSQFALPDLLSLFELLHSKPYIVSQDAGEDLLITLPFSESINQALQLAKALINIQTDSRIQKIHLFLVKHNESTDGSFLYSYTLRQKWSYKILEQLPEQDILLAYVRDHVEKQQAYLVHAQDLLNENFSLDDAEKLVFEKGSLIERNNSMSPEESFSLSSLLALQSLSSQEQQALSTLDDSQLFEKIQGKQKIHFHPFPESFPDSSAVVICAIKHAAFYLEAFIQHYQQLGFQHIMLIDMQSNDAGREIAEKFDHISWISIELPYHIFHQAAAHVVANQFAANCWNLIVDIEEFWDYPLSEFISLKSFLTYLNEQAFDRVLCHQLDVLPDDPSLLHGEKAFNKGDFTSFDPSTIEVDFDKNATIEKLHLPQKLTGGPLKQFFNIQDAALSSYALSKRGYRTFKEKQTSHIADVSTVLYHYPYTSDFEEKVTKATNGPFEEVAHLYKYQQYAEELAFFYPRFQAKQASFISCTGSISLLLLGILQAPKRFYSWAKNQPESAENQQDLARYIDVLTTRDATQTTHAKDEILYEYKLKLHLADQKLKQVYDSYSWKIGRGITAVVDGIIKRIPFIHKK